MILADTSVWVDHFRRANPRLTAALEWELVVTHPFVIGELACGNLANRREVLDLMRHLPAAPVASDVEALAFIEARNLMGRGIGYVDVHLLASAKLSAEIQIWALDIRLAQVARDVGIEYR